MAESNGWSEWKQHVLREQKRIADDVSALRADVTSLRLELAERRGSVRTGTRIAGAVAGFIAGIVATIVSNLFKP